MSNTEAPQTKGHTIRWWAPIYDAASALMGMGRLGETRKQTIQSAALMSGESVLDVGCGSGTLTLLAAAAVKPDGRVTGIDASPEMIKVATGKAKKRGAKAVFRVAPIEKLPFADGEFDVVLSSFMLHHLPDDVRQPGLAEVRRVLKPGGRFVAVDIVGTHGPLGLIMRVIGHRMPPDYTDQLKSAITAAGFEHVEALPVKQDWMVFLRAS